MDLISDLKEIPEDIEHVVDTPVVETDTLKDIDIENNEECISDVDDESDSEVNQQKTELRKSTYFHRSQSNFEIQKNKCFHQQNNLFSSIK